MDLLCTPYRLAVTYLPKNRDRDLSLRAQRSNLNTSNEIATNPSGFHNYSKDKPFAGLNRDSGIFKVLEKNNGFAVIYFLYG